MTCAANQTCSYFMWAPQRSSRQIIFSWVSYWHEASGVLPLHDLTLKSTFSFLLWNQGIFFFYHFSTCFSYQPFSSSWQAPTTCVFFTQALTKVVQTHYSQVAGTCGAKNKKIQSRRLWGRWTKQTSDILNHPSFSNQSTSNTATGPDQGEAEQMIALSAGIHRYDV